MNIKFYRIILTAVLSWLTIDFYNYISNENDNKRNSEYDMRLSGLIEKFQEEGKDYETSYTLAIKLLKERSEGVYTDRKNYSSLTYDQFNELMS